jgi:hypothetical protein
VQFNPVKTASSTENDNTFDNKDNDMRCFHIYHKLYRISFEGKDDKNKRKGRKSKEKYKGEIQMGKWITRGDNPIEWTPRMKLIQAGGTIFVWLFMGLPFVISKMWWWAGGITTLSVVSYFWETRWFE